MVGHPLPTVADAAAVVLASGGTLATQGGHLVIEVPERFAPQESEHEQTRGRVLDGVRVLLACEDLVVAAVDSRSTKPLVERLPSAYAAAGGGLADA